MSDLTKLLQDLGQDAELCEAYIEDPERVMERYRLADEEKQAMRDKDVEKLKKLTGLENIKANGTIQCHD